MKKFWFSGLWISLPAGIMLAFIYRAFIKGLRKLSMYGIGDSSGDIPLKVSDYLIMLLIVASVVLLIFLANVWRKIWYKEDNFSPFNRNQLTDRSREQKAAQNKRVPKEYLSSTPSDLTLGKYGSQYVILRFLESPEHQFIFGAPGSRKTSLMLNALIWFFNYAKNGLTSALVVDPKPELSRKSVYEDRDDVIIINPSESGGFGFDIWYGLSQNSSDDSLFSRANVITRAIVPELSGDNRHFSTIAQDILSSFLVYFFRKEMSAGKALFTIKNTEIQNLIAEICADDDMQKSHPTIIGNIVDYVDDSSEAFKSFSSTLKENLTIFNKETVQECLSSNLMASPTDLINRKSIFLAIQDSLVTEYKFIFGLIMELCIDYLMSIDESMLSGCPPVWILADEAGTIHIPSLHNAISRGRSKHIQVSVIAQNVSQLKELYGRNTANSIYSGCKTKIVLSYDDEKADEISSIIGDYRETKVSTHQSGIGAAPPDSTNTSIEYRRIITKSDIYSLEKDNKVIILNRGEWLYVNKCTYKDIPEYLALSDKIYQYNIGAGDSNPRREANYDTWNDFPKGKEINYGTYDTKRT